MTEKINLSAEILVKGYEMAIEEVFKAYPIDIFSEPSSDEYKEMNKVFSSFVTRHSANVGRHIANVIRERALYFANEILANEKDREAS